nr:NADH dehydrogenase subunit 6 [Lymnaea stagnalis]
MSFIFSLMMLCIFTTLFPLLSSPISLGSFVIGMSVCLVMMINMISSAWYSYLLFLVYIGGLLVLFIYMCLISSNTEFLGSISHNIFVIFSISMLCSWGFYSFNWCTLGKYTYDSGSNINLSLFMCLVIMLLLIFLAIVDIVKINSSLQIEEK